MLGFGTGVAALTAARSAIATIGHNLANASTPGYSRQRVLLESIGGNFIQGRNVGAGVRIGAIDRVTDDLLAGRVRQQKHEVGRREIALGNLQDIETIFGEPGENGISYMLTDFFNGLSSLSSAPDDSSVRGTVVQAGGALAERFRRISNELTGTVDNLDDQIASSTREVNSLAQSLAVINKQLGQVRGQGPPPSELLDRQSELVDQLSDIVDVTTRDIGGGRISVSIGGQMLVGTVSATPVKLEGRGVDQKVMLDGAAAPVLIRSGRLKGLIELRETGVADRVGGLDDVARALIRDFNRIHSTGVPTGGGFKSLVSNNQIQDTDGDGDFRDEKLASAGLPFDVSNGSLTVTVVDEATDSITRSTIDINPKTMTVGQLADALSNVAGLDANVDASGRLTISASLGKRFHFGASIDSTPNANGVFGSDQAQVAGTLEEPFALTNGDALSISVGGGPAQNVTFSSGQFADITQATADEVAQAINGSLVGATARVVDGRVVIRSDTARATSSIQISDATGTPSATLGLSNAIDQGADQAVNVTVGGRYTGISDDRFSFRAKGDGTIGVTPGLQVEVVDDAGMVIATLDVGAGYSPGTSLDVADGVTVSFGAGDISQSGADRFDLDLQAQSDSADVLVAFGLNAFFTGSDSSDIAVAESIEANPDVIAQGFGPAASDNRNILALLGLRDAAIDELDGRSIESYYNGVVADLGNDVARSELSYETEGLLLESYQNRLEQVRGVSIDEELAELQRYEQSYTAAAKYISAVNEVSRILFDL